MIKDCKHWRRKIATLRIERARGDPAPHKPLLLLVILEMPDKGEITGREIALSADLAFRFSVFWSIVAQRRRQRLVDFEGKRVFLPSDPKYWPEHGYITWHRRQHGFQGS